MSDKARVVLGWTAMAMAALVGVAVVAAPAPFGELGAWAQTPNQGHLALLGAFGGEPAEVAIEGDTAWVGVGHRLVAVDVSQPADPRVVGKTPPLPGVPRDVAVIDGFVFVALEQDGVYVVDGANLQGHWLVAHIDAPLDGLGTAPIQVVPAGDALYVSGGKTVTIADIADPANAIVTARYETAEGRQIRAMTARGDRVYLALAQGARPRTFGLAVMDVADKHRPALLGQLELADGVGGRGALAALDDVVLMGGSSGLRVVDVSDPRRPRLADKLLDMSFSVFEPHPDGGALLYALRTPRQGQTAVELVDFSDPSRPLVRATEWHELTAVELAASPKHLLMTDRSVGLSVVDAGTLRPAGSMPNMVVRHVDRDGAYGAAIAWGDAPARNRLVTFDPRVPEEADVLAEVPGLGDVVALDAEGAKAYVLSTRAGLRVVDLGAPGGPRIVGESGYFAWPKALAVSGATACVLDPTRGLTVLDVTEPLSITVTGLITTTRQALDVAIGGSTAWVSDGATLVAVDVGAGKRPTVLARHQVTVQVPGYPEPQPTRLSALAASDGLLFAVSSYGTDVVVFDVTEPQQLNEIGHLRGAMNGVRDIVVDGGRALLIGPPYGGSPDFTFSLPSGGWLTLVDVSDPSAPRQLVHRAVGGLLMGAAMGDGLIWLAGGTAGVTARRYHAEEPPATRTPAPTATAPPPQRSATPDSRAHQVFLPLLVRSPRSPERPLEITVEGAIGGVANVIAADGDRVYLGEADRVTILDTSDPERPKVLGTTEGLGNDIDHIAVQGTTLYVTCGMFPLFDYGDGGALSATSTIATIDVSDASRPEVLRRMDVGRLVTGPVVLSADTPSASSLLYVPVVDFEAETPEDLGELWVYDVSSPVNPHRVNSVALDGFALSMARRGSDLYAVVFIYADDYDIALQVFDLADPRAPVNREGAGDEVALHCENATIAVAGDTMLIRDYEMARLYDASNPAAIRPAGWLENPWEMEEDGVHYFEVLSVAAHGDLFYVLGNGEYEERWGTVLLSYEATAPGQADGVAWVALPGMQFDEEWMYSPMGILAAAPGRGYVAGAEMGGMTTVTHERRERMVVAGGYETPGQVGLAAADGPFAYAQGFDGRLTVLDVSSPASPRVVTATHSLIEATDLALAGEHLWLTSATAELGAVDVSDPARPVALPRFLGPSGVSGRRLAASGSTALVSGLTSGIAVFDVTAPGAAVLLSRYGTPGLTYDVAIDKSGSGAASTAYVADGADGLVVLDIADRQRPTEVGHLETAGDAVRVVHGSAPGWPDLVFVAVADPRRTEHGRPPTGSELRIVDVSSPSDPRLLSRFPMATGDVRDLLILDDAYALVIGQAGELIAVDIADATAPALVLQTSDLGDLRHLAAAGDKLVGAAGSGGLVVLRTAQ